ncbi:DUF7486 family protein [Algibacter mikhailovii]|uniref:DUF7486 domain-containing protein n=1 Tax=Algibacter mikhailovii TaxID=425498 RepID=A0A918QSX3_9FLAO|nr:hypothetical protein [Algibacter mikhailovii]GGZ69975.1 hypothetical protein GCM10007028_03850 [Algibacter mikhailovii]
MKKLNLLHIRSVCVYLFILGFLFTACNNSASKDKTTKTDTEEVKKVNDILWNVKAIAPDGKSLEVKGFNEKGESIDIKAVQNADQTSFLDVNAIENGNKFPVKLLVSKTQFSPVTAITNTGDTYELKAITPEGEKLDVKGVARFGYVVMIKAITKEGEFYGVKAISPTGELNDIKGIKINFQDREMSLKGLNIHAHVKAMHPAANEDDLEIPVKKKKKKVKKGEKEKSDFERIIWNIKAVTPDGNNLDIKAFDPEGNTFDVKATQDSKQHSFLNIKVLVEGGELPVKIMQSTYEYAPIKAIGTDGTLYDIKAITDNKEKLDVKGISRSGNIIHVKAVNDNGELFAVKAFAPDGKLNAVKGVKIFKREVELKIQGNPVYAHLKAINE